MDYWGAILPHAYGSFDELINEKWLDYKPPIACLTPFHLNTLVEDYGPTFPFPKGNIFFFVGSQ